YRLQAFLAQAQEHDVVLAPAADQARWKETTEKVTREIKKIQKTLRTLAGPERDRAEERVRALESTLPPALPAISTVRNVEAERAGRRPPGLLARSRGSEGAGGGLGAPPLPPARAGPDSRGRPRGTRTPRPLLARWAASPDTPLTAGVMVNRLWLWHFGRGIV